MDDNSKMTSTQYMQEATGDRMASCVKCGVLMARMYEDIGCKSENTFWCCSCGIVIYKSVLGVWKHEYLKR